MSDKLDSFDERLQASIAYASKQTSTFSTTPITTTRPSLYSTTSSSTTPNHTTTTLKSHHPQLFDRAAMKTITIIDTFNAEELSNTVNASIRMNHMHPDLFDNVAADTIPIIDSYNSQDLSNTVNAFATMKYHHSELFDNVATTAIPIINTFNPLGLTNTAFAKTNHTHQKFFNASPSLQHSDLWIQRLLSCQLPSYQHRKTQQQTYYLPELPHTLYHPFTYCLLQLLLLLHHMKQGFTKFYCTPHYITWLQWIHQSKKGFPLARTIGPSIHLSNSTSPLHINSTFSLVKCF